VSRRAIIYIVCGVVAFHVLVFFVLGLVNPMPKFKKIPRPPKPNFKHYERVEVDATTGEKMIYRDIEVSTKLTPRETLEKKETPAPSKGL
jgi:hypothetical protein